MIICDKIHCKDPAEYICNIDYNGRKDFQRIDLCTKHFNDFLGIVRNEEEEKLPPLNFQTISSMIEPKGKGRKNGRGTI